MALATLFGLVFGLLYLMRGSLVAPMVAHGAYDTAALLLYWFAGRGGGPSA
jgi:membrane protease YdiL (CAAX protease family)